MPSSDQPFGEQLALVQLPARVRRALRLFGRITGRTAVASVATAGPESGEESTLSPPVHPQCAETLRSLPSAPCGAQWSMHLRAGRRSSRMHVHTCPVGLRCSCVPIHFGGRLVGVAKLVVDGRTPDAAFRTSISILNLVVSEACTNSAVEVLSAEVRLLRQLVGELQELRAAERPRAGGSRTRKAPPRTEDADAAGVALVRSALTHLQRNYHDPALSLLSVAKALQCNPRYLTSRFTRVVGEHMHSYLVTLRVSHACHLLVTSNQHVKVIAVTSGFSRPGGMTRAFRTHVGVSPVEYRRLFASP